MQLLNSCQEYPQPLCPLLGHISHNAPQVLEENPKKLPNLHSDRKSQGNSNAIVIIVLIIEIVIVIVHLIVTVIII